MESSGSSFIPQRPSKGKVAAKSFRKIYVLSYVSYLVFFTTLLAVGGIFLYQTSLKSELKGLQEELVAQKNSFSQSDLDRVRSLDYRIDTATILVNSHASLLTLFNALDTVVTDPVQFLSFNYDRQEGMRQPQLSLTAVAKGFDEVIFQESVLRNNAITNSFDVANVSLSTQPINQERLELGVQQVVNVNLSTELPVSEINFTGLSASQNSNSPLATDESAEEDAATKESTEGNSTSDDGVEDTQGQPNSDSSSGQF